MDEPRVEELLYRIEILEGQKRHWKMIGLGSLAILLGIGLLGGLFTVSTAVMLREQREIAIQEREAAEQAMEEARQAERRARQEAERAAKEAGK